MKRSHAPSAQASKKIKQEVAKALSGGYKQFKKTSLRSGPAAKFTTQAWKRHAEEVKTLDIQFNGAYADAYTADAQPAQTLNCNSGTACVQSLNLIQQGAGIAQRIGNKVSLKSLRVRLTMSNVKAVTQLGTTQFRFIVIYDRNPNGSYLAANAILGESLQSNTTGTGTSSSNLNPAFFDRIVVLMDKQIILPPFDSGAITGTSTTGPSGEGTNSGSFQIDEFIKLKGLECVYNGTANPMTIAYQSVGSLQIVCFGNAAAASQPWGMVGSMRLRFHDN